jgi:lysophospholipid acyltransferase (LPLAT)-like uncharacterized protein
MTKGQSNNKGGREALEALVEHVRTGRPAILAVDGPRGPRSHVHKGIASLSRDTGAAVLNVITVPTRRWIMSKTWDRMQIPQPFCRIDAYFAPPLTPAPGESLEEFRRRIEASLKELEQTYDPQEANHPIRKRR